MPTGRDWCRSPPNAPRNSSDRDTCSNAMNEPARRKKVRLGDLLVEQKAITAEQLQLALVEQRRTGRRLGRVLADLKLLPEEKVQEVLAEHLQVPFVDVRQVTFAPETVRLLPEALARRYRALVLQSDKRGLLV